nr:MAG TPA: hypothetical protein [Caudoviricetes sp.]
MKDRISENPGRVKVTEEDGTSKYVTVERADNPTEEGTPLNRASLLSPKAQALLGLSDDATPSEALEKIIPLIQDTGWLPLWKNNDPTSDSRITVVAYENNENAYPAYRKIGNVVYLHGVVKPAAELPANINSEVTVGYLPVGFYNPDKAYFYTSVASQALRCRIYISSTGQIKLQRLGYGSTYAAWVANMWLSIDASFPVN